MHTLEHDCLHLSSEMGFKRSHQLKIYTIPIALSSHVFRLATSKVELFLNSLTTYVFHNVFLCILGDTDRFSLFVFAREKHPYRRPD